MDRRELIVGFIRENLSILTEDPLPDALYKKKKHEYFADKHSDSKQGIPRDQEIASETLWYLLRRNQIPSREELDSFLSKGLMATKINDPEVFYEFLQTQKSKSSIDFKKAAQGDLLESIRQQIYDEMRKEMSIDRIADIDQEIQKKMAEYQSLPSVLDSKEFSEPTQQPSQSTDTVFQPWWQQLNLTADPFPTTEGLRQIDPSAYDSVVVRTPIFQKYLSYLEQAPLEIFKNTIFFGEFGSGKTTLFEYLKRAFSAYQIVSIYVQLYSEKDLQSLKISFKEKMIEELKELLHVSDTDSFGVASTNVDNLLRLLLNLLWEKQNPKGLVVFVDDLHKNKEDFPVSLEFLSYLQIFTGEILRKISMRNVSFFIAGAREWEQIIKTQPRYSGSLATRETIPDITEDEAWTMLNKRLDAFYPNPEVKRVVDKRFVSQVYRNLVTNKLELTFRNFIQRLVDQFKLGNFKVLTSDPVHVSPEILQKIKTIVEADLILKERLRALLQERLQNEEGRMITLRLLLEIFIKRKVKETEYQDRLYYLQQLMKTRLITKVREGTKGEFFWAPCPELLERNRAISREFSLSLEDYLLKIYGITAVKRKAANDEIQAVKLFIDKCEPEGKAMLEPLLKIHSEIIDVQENYTLTSTELELAQKCTQSLEILTRFFAMQVEKVDTNVSRIGLNYWTNFWFSPGVVAQFQTLTSDPDICKERIWYVCSIYRQSFNTLFSFIERETRNLASVHITSNGLDNNDVTQLVEARNRWSEGDSQGSVNVLFNLVQNKIRTMIQTTFTILYGDMPARLRHIDEPLRQTLLQTISQKSVTPGTPFHEFSFLSLEQIAAIMVDRNSVSQTNNWEHIFSKIFDSFSKDDFTKFIMKLVSFKDNLSSDDNDPNAPSLDARELISTSLDTARKSNSAYVKLLTNGFYSQTSDGQTRLYFSLDGMRDKHDLVGIIFKPEILQNISSRLSSGQIRLNDQAFIQEYYAASYREFFAYLALTMSTAGSELKVSSKYRIESSNGTSINVRKLFSFGGSNPPRIFLCHSSKDKDFCRTLTEDLTKAGVRVWFDEFEIKVGDSISQKINEALHENDYLGIILTPSAVESEWVKRELSAALIKELDSKAVVILPLLYKPCTIPPLISDKRYANFTVSYERGLEELMNRFSTA